MAVFLSISVKRFGQESLNRLRTNRSEIRRQSRTKLFYFTRAKPTITQTSGLLAWVMV
jgi:hypothetical protein